MIQSSTVSKKENQEDYELLLQFRPTHLHLSACGFYVGAILCISNVGSLSPAVFLMHQTIELFFKSINGFYEDYLDGHDLIKLLDRIKKHDIALFNSLLLHEQFIKELNSHAYINFRYGFSAKTDHENIVANSKIAVQNSPQSFNKLIFLITSYLMSNFQLSSDIIFSPAHWALVKSMFPVAEKHHGDMVIVELHTQIGSS
ncbi:MAG: hypothetical protein Q7N87_01270 [Candidatus Uhrbacteria bacterium]|nr:hypothetical protein [Candidatus Uhrbacteria bacterium]